MPDDIHAVMMDSHIDPASMTGSADEMLASVRDDLQHLKDCYVELMMVAQSEGHEEIANYAQDRILAIAKQIWMLDSTLG